MPPPLRPVAWSVARCQPSPTAVLPTASWLLYPTGARPHAQPSHMPSPARPPHTPNPARRPKPSSHSHPIYLVWAAGAEGSRRHHRQRPAQCVRIHVGPLKRVGLTAADGRQGFLGKAEQPAAALLDLRRGCVGGVGATQGRRCMGRETDGCSSPLLAPPEAQPCSNKQPQMAPCTPSPEPHLLGHGGVLQRAQRLAVEKHGQALHAQRQRGDVAARGEGGEAGGAASRRCTCCYCGLSR